MGARRRTVTEAPLLVDTEYVQSDIIPQALVYSEDLILGKFKLKKVQKLKHYNQIIFKQ